MHHAGLSEIGKTEMLALQNLRDQFARIASRGRFSTAAAREWAGLLHEHRMALLMLAGIDGDLGDLGERSWLEIAEDERVRIRAAARSLQKDVRPLAALVGW
jgi:hypothetical protein